MYTLFRNGTLYNNSTLVLCTFVFLLQDKNALGMRTGVSIASFTWAIDGFKERVAEKTALSQSVSFTSNEFHWDGKRWRMLLFVKPPICKCTRKCSETFEQATGTMILLVYVGSMVI